MLSNYSDILVECSFIGNTYLAPMNGWITKLNDAANRSRLIGPMKWRISDQLHKAAFDAIVKKSDKRLVRLLGIQRSGNHAIVGWLLNNLGGKVIFCNDLSLGQHPRNAPMKKLRWRKGSGSVIVSYENYQFDELGPVQRPEWYGSTRSVHDILLIRDPFNLFASHYVWPFPQGVKFREDRSHRQRIIDLWKSNARSFLQFQGQADSTVLCISYNHWLEDADYREQCARSLGMDKASKSHEVMDFGGGSSFEGISSSDGNRKYLQRFLSLVGNEDFRSIFVDHELIALSERIFGQVEGTQELLNQE